MANLTLLSTLVPTSLSTYTLTIHALLWIQINIKFLCPTLLKCFYRGVLDHQVLDLWPINNIMLHCMWNGKKELCHDISFSDIWRFCDGIF